MESLSRWFETKFLWPPRGLSPPEAGGLVCTVIGSGGKSSLIWLLAKSQRGRNVLVSPTTKMYPPPPELRWYDRYFPGGENALPPPETGESPVRGITLAGVINKKTGKLEALPQKTLEAAVSGYDLALLEGDGSRNLPLKGWADHEPVVPPCTAVTIGVIPVTPVGETVSRDIIFRLPRFLRVSGAQEGSPVTPGHLAAVITGKTGERGLFSAALGRKLLVINQVEDEARREQAREIVARLPEAFLAGLEGIVAGSVRQDRAEVLR